MTAIPENEFDAKTETHLAVLYPGYAGLLRSAMREFRIESGRTLRIVEALRSFSRQRELYAISRTAPGKKVTDVMAGNSVHHYGIAADVAFTGDDPYLALAVNPLAVWCAWGACAERHGLTWGGNWDGDKVPWERGESDGPHTQRLWGFKVERLRDIYTQGGIRSVWLELDVRRGVPVGTGWADRNLFDPNKT